LKSPFAVDCSDTGAEIGIGTLRRGYGDAINQHQVIATVDDAMLRELV